MKKMCIFKPLMNKLVVYLKILNFLSYNDISSSNMCSTSIVMFSTACEEVQHKHLVN